MKTYFLVFTLIFSSVLNLTGQSNDFAPVGTKWYYNELDFAQRVVPHILESVGKENYQGKWCSKLVVALPSIGPLPSPTYIYTQNDTVFFYSNLTNKFEMLYDFTAEVGDQWVVGGVFSMDDQGNKLFADTIRVDSISAIAINGGSLKVWHISHGIFYDWGPKIYEHVGNASLFAPKYAMWELQVWDLRCFETPDTSFHFVPYPCDTSYSTISATLDPNESSVLKVAPNPFQEEITITSGTQSIVFSFSLYDQTGRTVFFKPNAAGNLVVNTEPLTPGLYYWNIVIGGVIVKSGKCVKT